MGDLLTARVRQQFSVRGGPHDGADFTSAEAQLRESVDNVGGRFFAHEPDENVYGFVVDASSPRDAFAIVTAVFRPVYGRQWWAEVATTGNLN